MTSRKKKNQIVLYLFNVTLKKSILRMICHSLMTSFGQNHHIPSLSLHVVSAIQTLARIPTALCKSTEETHNRIEIAVSLFCLQRHVITWATNCLQCCCQMDHELHENVSFPHESRMLLKHQITKLHRSKCSKASSYMAQLKKKHRTVKLNTS